MNKSLWNEMKPMRPLATIPVLEGTLGVSLIIPAKNSADTLEATVVEACEFLRSRYPGDFEIILVPNPTPGDTSDRSTAVAQELAHRYPEVRVCPHIQPRGKGAAIRTGFMGSRGRWIFLTDADLPYDLRFFDQATELLRKGYDLVTGNRRLLNSHFSIPVHLLRIAYGRHRLGLAFNRLVRLLLPITTTDTQAGIKALSRKLAVEAFTKQVCPGFLYDLELFLTANALGFRRAELPVTLYLNSEKSTVRIIRECILVGTWLTRITLRNLSGLYSSQNKSQNNHQKSPSQKRILARYQKASLGTRLFLYARWKLTPYSRMAAQLPNQGQILDLGCGHGLFALAAALKAPSRQVIGIDHDEQRIGLASQAVQDLPNIKIRLGSLTEPPSGTGPMSGIAMIDVMHYFDPNTQEKILKNAYQLLEKGGTLIVREVDPNGGLASRWNRLYEKLATGIGFTQAEKKDLFFRSRDEWEQLLGKQGFKVRSERCSSFLFADILYTCERH